MNFLVASELFFEGIYLKRNGKKETKLTQYISKDHCLKMTWLMQREARLVKNIFGLESVDASKSWYKRRCGNTVPSGNVCDIGVENFKSVVRWVTDTDLDALE